MEQLDANNFISFLSPQCLFQFAIKSFIAKLNFEENIWTEAVSWDGLGEGGGDSSFQTKAILTLTV